MSMLSDIVEAEQSRVKVERDLALKKLKARKQETRKKIEWGGLIVKAGMSQYPKDIILGALIEAYEEIQGSSESKRLFELKGADAFVNRK